VPCACLRFRGRRLHTRTTLPDCERRNAGWAGARWTTWGTAYCPTVPITERRRNALKRKIITAALVALAAVFGAGTAHASTDQDELFVGMLTKHGIPVASVRQASNLGWGVCGELARRTALAQVEGDVMAVTGLSPDNAQFVVIEAQFTYCPNTPLTYF
jgi:hypothetical protein